MTEQEAKPIYTPTEDEQRYAGRKFGKLTINETGSARISELVRQGLGEQEAVQQVMAKDVIALGLSSLPKNVALLFDLLVHLQRYCDDSTPIIAYREGFQVGSAWVWTDVAKLLPSAQFTLLPHAPPDAVANVTMNVGGMA
jgi:hypothetical protein